MPESSRLSSETRKGSHKGVKLWENEVCNHMAHWFERTQTPRVFRLLGSAGSASLVA